MNKIILIGRLTKDPELRYTQGGTAVVSFALAVNRMYAKKGEQEADFINIVVWNKAAENCAKYISKGRQVAVEGRLQIRTYDGNDGQKRWVTEVIAENVEYLDSSKKPEMNPEPMGQEIIFDDGDVPF